MKKIPFLLFTAAVCGMVSAQMDKVPSGLRPFSTSEPRKANEVTVVLDPPSSHPLSAREESPAPESPPLIENAQSLPEPEMEPEPPVSKNPKKPGVVVRVEKIQTTSGPVDPADVQLLAPFPAKPLSSIPKGWKLDSSGSAPAFVREIEVSPGSNITLNIRPHVLVPDTDGATTFGVEEPGYNAAQGYQQTGTVGAILSSSIRQLEDDSRQMGDAIDRLQQLLVSLPKSEPEAAPKAPAAKPGQRK